MELFKGMEEAYGEYAIADKPADPETKKKQGQAVTIREPVQNLDDLLGIEKRGSLRRSPDKEGFGWRLPIYEFRF